MAEDVALLLRRAGFGPTPAELAAARQAGYAATVSALTAPPGPDLGAASAPVPHLGPDPAPLGGSLTPAQRATVDTRRGVQLRTLTRWWLDRLTVADHQAYEKLVFFWHGHWATSVRKVLRPQLMLTQHLALRRSPDFASMSHRMVADPALIFWLDGDGNTRSAPNENLARELMELFMLGIGHYTEHDVKQAGRALTGWRIDYDTARAHLHPASHDAGPKTILGVTRNFDAHGLVDLLLSRAECPRFVAARLWYRYATSARPIPASTLNRMAAAFPDSMAMLRELLRDEAFPDTAGRLVKQPVEWLVGAARQLGVRPAGLPDRAVARLLSGLDGMGQVPFAPGSVGGWPAGAAWLTGGAAQARLAVAGQLAELSTVADTDPEALAHLLGLDGWSDRTYSALKQVTDPRRRLVLALAAPEYLVT